MTMLSHAHKWIEQAWKDMGRKFGASCLPVAQFSYLDVDDSSFPFKNQPISLWLMRDGKLEKDTRTKIVHVPYIAFSINEETREMNIQVQWAGLCGYGWELVFDRNGKVTNQEMCWIS